MTTRMAEEIERNCVELGGEGRLIRMQLDELMEDVRARKPQSSSTTSAPATRPTSRAPEQRAAPASPPPGVRRAGRGRRVPARDEPAGLHCFTWLPGSLAHPAASDSIIRHVVRDFRSLDAVIRASHRDLEAVDGVGSVRAREIPQGLRRLQEHNLVDRYLQL